MFLYSNKPSLHWRYASEKCTGYMYLTSRLSATSNIPCTLTLASCWANHLTSLFCYKEFNVSCHLLHFIPPNTEASCTVQLVVSCWGPNRRLCPGPHHGDGRASYCEGLEQDQNSTLRCGLHCGWGTSTVSAGRESAKRRIRGWRGLCVVYACIVDFKLLMWG